MLAQDRCNRLNGRKVSTKAQIAFVGTKTLNAIGQRVASRLDNFIDLTFIDSTFDDATAQVKSLISHKDIDAIVSSGGNEFCLSNAIPQLPLTHIPIDGFDLLNALAKAANTSKKIGLISYDNRISKLLAPIGGLLKYPVILGGFTDLDTAGDVIDRMKRDGCAIVGSSLIVDLAKEAGIKAHHYYSDRNVAAALQSAFLTRPECRADFQSGASPAEIVNNFNEATLLLDQSGKLISFNRYAQDTWQEHYGINLKDNPAPMVMDFMTTTSAQSGLSGCSDIAGLTSKYPEITTIPFRLNSGEQCSLLIHRPPASRKRKNSAADAGSAKYKIADFLGQSEAAKHIQSLSLCYAQSDATVLISGESGTGKEVIAQGIHNLGHRKNQPFIALNMSAMQESLIESELFGYEDGTFTGSKRGGKTGLFEAADGGTVFLDEIGDMPLALQTRLLRVLQEKEIIKLGSHKAIPIDVRIIAATNKDLRAEITAGRFREDLFYRLNILDISVPPLRERREDIYPISLHFLEKLVQQSGKSPILYNYLEQVITEFRHYNWPGNVRELENIVERLYVYFQHQQDAVLPDLMTLESICPELDWSRSQDSGYDLETTPKSLKFEQKEHEMSHIRKVLEECDNNVSIAAKKLGISRTTLWRKTKKNCSS